MALFEINNQPEEIDFSCNSDVLQRTIQNAKNLLMCRAGEVPYNRRRGLDPALFDLPFPELQDNLLPELDRVMSLEPDAEVVDAVATLLPDGGVLIEVVLEIAVGEAAETE